MANKALGASYKGVLGWTKVSDVPQTSGEATIVFRGVLSSLAEAKIAIANDPTLVYNTMQTETDEETQTATITLTKSAINTESKPNPEEGQTKLPTVSIQGTMLSPQLHQHPTFSSGENPLTLSAIAKINYCLKTLGNVTTGDLDGEPAIAKSYARWRSYGIDTYLAPSYTMTITYYLDKTKKAKDFILEAGKVFKFVTAIAKLPKDIQPEDLGVPAWLAQAPSINITSDGVTVSQSFVGAKAFPSFYTAEDKVLVYDAPELPDEYWRNRLKQQLSSGQE